MNLILTMLLLGYKVTFNELAILLNISVIPDADYVEDDYARYQIETQITQKIKNTRFTVMELKDGTFYLGFRPSICDKNIPTILSSRQICSRIQILSVAFHQELKRTQLLSYSKCTFILYPEPQVIQMH
jgi:hypothetical protein